MHRPATGRALAGAPPTKDPAPDDPGAEIEALRQEVASLKARLARAEELADADVLTPVLNRRAFLRELNRSVDLVRRYGNPAAQILALSDDALAGRIAELRRKQTESVAESVADA